MHLTAPRTITVSLAITGTVEGTLNKLYLPLVLAG